MNLENTFNTNDNLNTINSNGYNNIPNSQSANKIIENSEEQKKSGKIIFNEDPVDFEVNEMVETQEGEKGENSNIEVQKSTTIELPKEQSGNITF